MMMVTDFLQTGALSKPKYMMCVVGPLERPEANIRYMVNC